MNRDATKIAAWLRPYQGSITQFIGNSHFEEILDRWTEPHRKFHTQAHLRGVIESISPEDVALVLAAFYHDAVYEPGIPDNEAKSADLLCKHSQEFAANSPDPEARTDHGAIIAKATQIILSTAEFHHKQDPDEESFFRTDCQALLGNWEALLVYEEQICSEFQNVPQAQYLSGRCTFLEKASEVFPENAELLLRLRDHVKESFNQ